jgi:hypothetical protein
MKPLDDYIRKNLERFNSDEPLSGHFDRFDMKLAQLNVRNNRVRYKVLFRVAAAVLLGVLLSYVAVREFGFLNERFDQFVSAASCPELNEAERYYTSQLDIYYKKIRDLEFDHDKAEKRRIIHELNEMDKQVWVMKQDLRQNPEDERIVHAIINFYQVKIELMDMIISRTNESKKQLL